MLDASPIALTPRELERLQEAYGSTFYRRLVAARVELRAAIETLDGVLAETDESVVRLEEGRA